MKYMLLSLKHMKIIFALVFVIIIFFIFTKNHNFLQKTNSIVVNQEQKNETWLTYYDEKYRYNLSYPSELIATPKYEQVVKGSENFNNTLNKLNGGVNFSQVDGYGIIDVSVFENTNFISTDDWIDMENRNSEHQKIVIEERIIIDNDEAVVTHTQGDFETEITYFPEKTTVLIKDDILLKLVTRFVSDAEHRKVWDSFHFDSI